MLSLHQHFRRHRDAAQSVPSLEPSLGTTFAVTLAVLEAAMQAWRAEAAAIPNVLTP
jgi:hypothetical protein